LVGGGRPTGLLELLAELHERVHGDAVPLSTSHDQSRGELVAELRRDDQAALLVELGREGAEERQRPASPAPARRADAIAARRALLYATSPRQWAQNGRTHRARAISFLVSGVGRGGGKFSPGMSPGLFRHGP